MYAYWPRAPIGGGAWLDKGFFKADRAGGLHARQLARLVVELELATEARVTLHWFPGDREARTLDIATAEGSMLSAGKLVKRVDLSLARSGEHFCVHNLFDVARWGHFTAADYPREVLQQV